MVNKPAKLLKIRNQLEAEIVFIAIEHIYIKSKVFRLANQELTFPFSLHIYLKLLKDFAENGMSIYVSFLYTSFVTGLCLFAFL
jgi:hypothetical protein